MDPEAAIFRIEVRSYLMHVDGLNVLIDTCCGNDKQRSVPWAHRLQTQWLQNLAGAGCNPEISTWCCARTCMPTMSDGILA